jgi:hypothetical protein
VSATKDLCTVNFLSYLQRHRPPRVDDYRRRNTVKHLSNALSAQAPPQNRTNTQVCTRKHARHQHCRNVHKAKHQRAGNPHISTRANIRGVFVPPCLQAFARIFDPSAHRQRCARAFWTRKMPDDGFHCARSHVRYMLCRKEGYFNRKYCFPAFDSLQTSMRMQNTQKHTWKEWLQTPSAPISPSLYR